MTRFARAKGSKASNELKEEDPTPWHVMRQQLAQQLNKNGNDCETKSSCDDNTSNKDVFKSEKETWFEFNEFKLHNPNLGRDTKRKSPKDLSRSQNETICIKKKNRTVVQNISNYCLSEIKEDPVNTNYTKPNQNKCKSVSRKGTECKKPNPTTGNICCNKTIKTKKSKINKSSSGNFIVHNDNETTTVEVDVKYSKNLVINKKNKREKSENIKKELKINKVRNVECANTEQELIKLTQLEILNSKTSQTLKNLIPNNGSNEIPSKVANNKRGYKKEFQSFSSNSSRNNVQTIIANGRQIEIVRFEAFWVKKEDASKLKELRRKLRDQKMPNDKIKTIIKLERRKAEKALSREKTNVCYLCRKFGHKFSECPEVNDSSMSKSGICFKCGSTEHTHFECKVTHSQNFRYAVCFVCNEQGHIAKQCSLNPQGQYPKGGSCHLCGEVTHLRKDCPKAFEEKPSSFVTAEKINSIGLEDVSEMKTNNKKQTLVRNKVVLF